MEAEIEIQIDEVLLINLGRVDSERVKAALITELQRLFVEHDLPLSISQGYTVTAVDCGTLRLKPGMTPEAIGQQIAFAVWRGLR